MDQENMNRKWIEENELPEGAPTGATGWNLMLEELEKQMPETALLIPGAGEENHIRQESLNTAKRDDKHTGRRLIILILLLVAFLATWYSLIHLRQNGTIVSSAGNPSPKYDIAKKSPPFSATRRDISAKPPDHADVKHVDAPLKNTAVKTDDVLEDLKNKSNTAATRFKPGKKSNTNTRINGLLTYFVPHIRSGLNEKRTRYGNGKVQSAAVNDNAEMAAGNEKRNDVLEQLSAKWNSGPFLEINRDARVWAISGDQQLPVSQNQETQQEVRALKIHVGLAWSLPIPFNGTTNYFSGPNGSLAPYYYALPSLWASIYPDEKNAFTVEIDPFETAMVNSKAQIDSATGSSGSGYLDKLFGVSLRLGYDRDVRRNWWVGFGLEGDWWESGAATIYQPEWGRLSRIQIFLNGTLTYKSKNWEAGVRAGIAFIALSKDSSPKNVIDGALFFRLPIFKFNSAHGEVNGH